MPCDCCHALFRDPPVPDEPAAYEWVSPGGRSRLLCVSCCALWRQNAAEDPALLPISIRLLESS